MGKKRLIERKIVNDEKIGYTRICMLRAFLRLPGRDSKGKPKPTTETANTGKKREPAKETVDTGEEGKPAKGTANTGLPDSEINPELSGVIAWLGLANLIEKIQASVQQGELTWEEVYLLFEKIFNTLEAKLKTTREEAIFGFRKSLSALREKIAEIITSLSREVFAKITGSKMFKQSIMTFFTLITVGVLVVNPIIASPTHAEGSNCTACRPAYSTILYSPNSGSDSSPFINQLGVSSSNFENTGSVQAYDLLEGGSENGESEEFNLEQALNLLKKHPTILNNTLFQIINEINLLQETDKQPSITELKIVKKDGSLIVKLSGSTNFSEGVYKFDSRNGTFELYAQTENGEYDISHTGGVVVAKTPYILKGGGGVEQYTSGVITLEGHCCGRSANFAVFKLLHHSKGGIVEIHARGKVYKLDIVAVGVLNAQESMDILSFDYEKIEEYFAKLLGLYDGTNPQWKQTLSSGDLKKLNQLMKSFLAGELIFLRTCDGDPNSLYVGSNGQLQSAGRVVAVATLQSDQEPFGFMKPPFVLPVEFVQGRGFTIRIENEEDWEIIEGLFKRLSQTYPQIVQELLRAAIAEARRFEGPQHSNSGTDTNSNSNLENSIDNTPILQPPIEDSSSSEVKQTDPDLVDSGLLGQTGESQTEETFAQKIKYLNEELSKAGLDEILPLIEFMGETDVIDLQALVRQIKSSNKGLPSLITHFLMNRHHLGLLSDYIQVLDQLAVGAPDGGYKQNLNDFAHELRLAELAVRRLLPAGVVIISIIILLWFFFLRIQKGKDKNHPEIID